MATAQAWKVLNTDPGGDGGLVLGKAHRCILRLWTWPIVEQFEANLSVELLYPRVS